MKATVDRYGGTLTLELDGMEALDVLDALESAAGRLHGGNYGRTYAAMAQAIVRHIDEETGDLIKPPPPPRALVARY